MSLGMHTGAALCSWSVEFLVWRVEARDEAE